MDNKKLINLVEGHKCLYDLNDRGYNDNHNKDAAWREISISLNANERECRKAWALLRDAYRRAIKKHRKRKSGQASLLPHKRWKYEEEMKFLLPHIKKRISVSTVRSTESDVSRDSFVSPDADPGSFVEHLSDKLSAENYLSGLNAASTSTSRTPSKCQRRTLFKDKKCSSDEITSAALMKYILDNKKNTNDIEQFFAGIAATVQTFPLQDRAIAKAKVFEVISKMEIEILCRPSASSSDQSPVSFHSNHYQDQKPL